MEDKSLLGFRSWKSLLFSFPAFILWLCSLWPSSLISKGHVLVQQGLLLPQGAMVINTAAHCYLCTPLSSQKTENCPLKIKFIQCLHQTSKWMCKLSPRWWFFSTDSTKLHPSAEPIRSSCTTQHNMPQESESPVTVSYAVLVCVKLWDRIWNPPPWDCSC